MTETLTTAQISAGISAATPPSSYPHLNSTPQRPLRERRQQLRKLWPQWLPQKPKTISTHIIQILNRCILVTLGCKSISSDRDTNTLIATSDSILILIIRSNIILHQTVRCWSLPESTNPLATTRCSIGSIMSSTSTATI